MKAFTIPITALFIFLAFVAIPTHAAIYKDEVIDGKTFRAEVWLEEQKSTYRVSVVFVNKAANLIFDTNQVLPPVPRNDRFLTLYLFDEHITNPDKIKAKQVAPPDELTDDNENPATWPPTATWYIKLNLTPPEEE